MYTQTEGDFWKEKLVLMQRQSMRLSGNKITTADAENKISEIRTLFPALKTELSSTESYVSCDFTVSDSLKVRLYIQNQTKITFLGKNGSVWEKICDSKFPGDPFPLLIHFFSHILQYQSELKTVLEEQRRFEKQQKITGELIKSLLKRKFDGTGIIWHLEPRAKDFILKAEINREKKEFPISFRNFREDIKNLNI